MNNAPKLKNKFICIVDRHSPQLAAMVSSYLVEDDYYLPLFEIQGVTAPHSKPIADPPDEDTFSQQRAEMVCQSIRNAIVRLGGCEHIVLVGLSEDQKSYLQLPPEMSVIPIESPENVDAYLSPFFQTSKPILTCLPEEYLLGQYEAVRTGHWLRIDQQAAPITPVVNGSGSCVVVENDGSAMAVMAVNYALSVRAELVIVRPLADREDKDILYYLADWQQNGDLTARNQVLDAIQSRIGTYDFSGYCYVTFFTAGIPYSLVLGDRICCTYVHLYAAPDHFTFSNIFYAEAPGTGVGLVFSPLELTDPPLPAAQAEIDDVSYALTGLHYQIYPLVSKQASVYHLSRHLQHFPYELLHICTHGGEIPGKRIRSEFIDSKGTTHTFEYDHVMSFAATPYKSDGEPLYEVGEMAFPRSYNGWEVGSPELQNQQYGPDFFVECQNAVTCHRTLIDTWVKDVDQVTDSRHIMCSDYPFFALINYLAGGMKPIVFNNTCWSWGPVATSFLEKEARGYVGTLWWVKDGPAAASAKAFYEHVLTMPVANAIHLAAQQHQPDEDKNIYVFYGFPFTRLHPGLGTARSKELVLQQLVSRRQAFLNNRRTTTNQKVKEDLDFIIAWHDEALAQLMK